MSDLVAVAVPIAAAGALLAGVSVTASPGWGRWTNGRARAGGGRRGARWARRRDLRSLLVPSGTDPAGRLVLGLSPGFVRAAAVAAEPAQSLVVVGPTQSGKTTRLAVPAILSWRGPVVAASVKSDLLHLTLGPCTRRGQVWCIDPTASTSATRSGWTPLTGCEVWTRACRVAADLCEAAKSDGTTADGEFWYAAAAKLLAPLFVAGALEARPMADIVRWVDTQETGEVAAILERASTPEPLQAAQATWYRDERTRSSVYTTAETVLAPFAHEVAVPTGASRFEADELLGGFNTLFLCAPAHDQRRLRGYFTAITQRVLAHAFATATRAGRPLDPPLLLVLDEAAHIAPLPELDGLAATCASHGIQLVTVWQDLAQVRSRFGARAATVLNNHRAKLFLPGIADPDTLDYASRLVGDEEAVQPSMTRDPAGRRSTTSTTGPRRLLPPEQLRCLPRGEAVLVYGTLPPARLRLRPWPSSTRRGRARWR
jgi:type IV secretion system protein VirD4